MGFEVVVRPAVLPDIRPPPARSLPVEDAPDKGIAVINGIGNSLVDLTYSTSSSWSRTRLVEEEREFDKVRVYASEDGGGGGEGTRSASARSIDQSTYVDFEVMTKIKYRKNGQDIIGQQYAAPEDDPENGVKVIERGLTRRSGE